MGFEVKKFNDVVKFDIGLSENNIAANMAEILHLNDHNSISITGRDLLCQLYSFEVKEFNDVIRFKIGRSEKQKWRPIWRKIDI